MSEALYNKQYYQRLFSGGDLLTKVTSGNFGDVPEKMTGFLKLSSKDSVVDFGCGGGSLGLLLNLRYRCRVIGLDISKDAIILANKHKKELEKAKIFSNLQKVKFLALEKDSPFLLKNIKAVYFQDVLEHMTDKQIRQVLAQVKKWNPKIKLVIHTDNNLYLKYVRPVIYFLNLFFHKTTREEINKGKNYEDERHINLMTVNQLKRKLLKYGFVTEKIEYSTLNYANIKAQLRGGGQIKLLVEIIYLLARLLFFLRPSFYLVAAGGGKIK